MVFSKLLSEPHLNHLMQLLFVKLYFLSFHRAHSPNCSRNKMTEIIPMVPIQVRSSIHGEYHKIVHFASERDFHVFRNHTYGILYTVYISSHSIPFNSSEIFSIVHFMARNHTFSTHYCSKVHPNWQCQSDTRLSDII